MSSTNTKKNIPAEIAGYIGMILIHMSTIPPIIKVLMGISTNLPPIEMVLMVMTGLLLFLIRAAANKDILYIISNGIGFFFNSMLMAMIVYKG